MSLQTKKWVLKNRLKKMYYRCAFKNCKLSNSFIFRDGFRILAEKTATVTIGDNTFFNNFCSINCQHEISIGKDCLFGEGVKIYDHNHKFNRTDIPIRDQGFNVHPVHIGDNVWVGSNVLILAGSDIGDHCVIAGGVTINYRVPPNSLVKRDGSIVEIVESWTEKGNANE